MDHLRRSVTTNYRTHGQGESRQALNAYVCSLREARIRKDWEPRIHAFLYNNACVYECRVCAITHQAAAPAYDAHGGPAGGKTIRSLNWEKVYTRHSFAYHRFPQCHTTKDNICSYVNVIHTSTQPSNTTPESGRKKNKTERYINRSSPFQYHGDPGGRAV